jgi:LysR family transcriptional regulator, carnitine catabolism transcriptional activator
MPGSGLRRLTDQTLGQLTLGIKPAFEVANVQTALGLVAAGLGVSVLPAYSLARVYAEQLVSVPLVAPVVSRALVAVCRRAQSFSMAAKEFLRLL